MLQPRKLKSVIFHQIRPIGPQVFSQGPISPEAILQRFQGYHGLELATYFFRLTYTQILLLTEKNKSI